MRAKLVVVALSIVFMAVLGRVQAGKPGHASAARAFEGGDLWKAERLARAALRDSPSNAQLHALLGRILLERARYEDAEAHYRLAVQHEPDYWMSYAGLSVICAQQGNREEGHRHLARAIALAPESVDAYVTLGAATVSLGLYDESVEYYHKGIGMAPDRMVTYLRLGEAYELSGQDAQALSAYQQLLERVAQLPRAEQYPLRRLRDSAGKRVKAIQRIQNLGTLSRVVIPYVPILFAICVVVAGVRAWRARNSLPLLEESLRREQQSERQLAERLAAPHGRQPCPSETGDSSGNSSNDKKSCAEGSRQMKRSI